MSRGGTIATVIAVIAGVAVCYWFQVAVFDKMTGFGDSMMMYQRMREAQMRGMPGPPPQAGSDMSSVGDQVMDQVVEMVNKTCPRQADSETRLDSVGKEAGNVFAEYCTLVHINKATDNIDNLQADHKSRLLSSVKDNAGFKVFRDANVVFKFYYKDKNGDDLMSITIAPADYN
jgi:hypothetical protein